MEFHNVKALYRRAQAYLRTADLHLAESDIKKALEADPHNRYGYVILRWDCPNLVSSLSFFYRFYGGQ